MSRGGGGPRALARKLFHTNHETTMQNVFKKIENLTPNCSGGFSDVYIIDGRVLKVMEDACFDDVAHEVRMQATAAQKGLAPKIHEFNTCGSTAIIEMDEVPVGYRNVETEDEGMVPTMLWELPWKQQLAGFYLYMKLLRAGIVHADFHTGNWFLNSVGDGIVIDFGLSSHLAEASLRHLKRAIQVIINTVSELCPEDGEMLQSVMRHGDELDCQMALQRVAEAF